jgi:putative transposase
MIETTDIRTGRHCVFNLHVHLVFVTKYRRKVFNKLMLDCMKDIFNDICQHFAAELIEFDGEGDHVHLLVHYPPKISISKLVNSLKGVSSRLLRVKFTQQIGKFYWKGVLWSPSYFAGSCGGAPISVIRKYIEQQNTPKI